MILDEQLIILMMIIRNRAIFTFCTAISRYLKPFALNVVESESIPTLKLKSEKQLLKNWWSVAPFQTQDNLRIPIFGFHSNSYLGKAVDVPAQYFNQPLRRDLIYRLYNFRENLNKFSTAKTRNRAETAGSGAKMRPQKKSGRARIGDKRAPHLRKGGKAHGKKPKIYSFPLNAKIKLKALEALLSAKMSEGKIKIIDDQSIQEPKTKFVMKAIRNHQKDERAIFCIITSQKSNQNFQFGRKNIPQIIWHDPYNLDVKSLFIADKILFTLKGLEEFIENINKTKYVIYRQPYQPEIPTEQTKQESQQKWDPERPYEFKFRILAEYLEQYEKVKKQTPGLLEKEFERLKKRQTA